MIVELPSGKTAHLRSADQVPERLRRPCVDLQLKLLGGSADLMKAMRDRRAALLEDGVAAADLVVDPELRELSKQMVNSDAVGIGHELNDVLIVAFVATWEHDLPVTLTGVLDLPGGDYDKLREAVAKMAVELMPDFGPSPDPDSPTSGSEPSVTRSEPTPALQSS